MPPQMDASWSEGDEWTVDNATAAFFPALMDSFGDGRAFDSVHGGFHQMADILTFDYFDFTQYGAWYGNDKAYNQGTVVGTVWGTANWIAIAFGPWAAAPAGPGTVMLIGAHQG